MDKTTVDGLAEAILLGMSSLTDSQGFSVRVELASGFSENLEMARRLASVLLGKEYTPMGVVHD